MIVSDVAARNDYVGDASTDHFVYTFAITNKGHIEVLKDGVALTLDTDYTVYGVDDEVGGYVLISPAPATGVKICLLRKQPFSQESVYQANEDFPAKRLEKDLNKVAMVVQQLREISRRSLAFAKKSLLTNPILPDGVVGKVLSWKTTTELENIDPAVFVPGAVSLPLSIANGGTAAATAANARTNLDVPSNAEAILDALLTTKGDLIAATAASTPARLGVGTNGQVLTADSGELAGVKWGAPAAATPVGAYGVRNLVGQNDAVTPNTKFGYSADLVVLRKVSDNTTVVKSNTGTLTNDVTVSAGSPDGRDQAAAFSAGSWIHFYFIWNGTTLGTLSSLTAPPTGPTLPSGYTHWAYAGAVRYNATPGLVKTYWRGAHAYYQTIINVVNASTATTEQTVSVSTQVPPNALGYTLFVYKTAYSNEKFRLVTGVDWTRGVTSGNVGDYNYALNLPNVAQEFFFIKATSNAIDVDVVGYKMPNGGE